MKFSEMARGARTHAGMFLTNMQRNEKPRVAALTKEEQRKDLEVKKEEGGKLSITKPEIKQGKNKKYGDRAQDVSLDEKKVEKRKRHCLEWQDAKREFNLRIGDGAKSLILSLGAASFGIATGCANLQEVAMIGLASSNAHIVGNAIGRGIAEIESKILKCDDVLKHK